MTQSFSSPVVVCRPALPKDTADVKEFCKFTWDGGRDYVLHAWDGWLEDSEGILAVAEYAGHAVGLAKLTLLTPGQWWLEGFRVDPKFQGQRIGSHLHGYIDQWWLENGDGVARLITHSHRVRVHHLCEKFGYRRTLEVTGFVAPPLRGPTNAFQPVKDSEVSDALQFADSAPLITLNRGLIDLGWCFVTPNRASMQRLVDEKLAWWWRAREGLLLAWMDEGETPADVRIFAVGLPACQPDALPELLLDVRRLAENSDFALVFWIAPLENILQQGLKMAGFERKWENSAYIFEKQHPLSGTDMVPI